jgi:hypothetical protein
VQAGDFLLRPLQLLVLDLQLGQGNPQLVDQAQDVGGFRGIVDRLSAEQLLRLLPQPVEPVLPVVLISHALCLACAACGGVFINPVRLQARDVIDSDSLLFQ